MPKRYRDSDRNEIVLGRRIGAGGEGAVFEIAGRSDLVAKVYHRAIPREKSAKLSKMARTATPGLIQFAAWPQTTVHEWRTGEIVGIVMARIRDARPIHELYSPAQRKVHFAKADWRFLIRTARNCASAFAALHNHGIVVGDVNQGNALVSSRALVTFIDCDSFQIAENGRFHLCRVGVPHFTPPELHAANFDKVVRTKNHDVFGLAVLIFHLLFMGRHPFAGRFLGSGDMPIERAIRENRFAYGAMASRRLMQPPPNAIVLADVSIELARSFERAFVTAARPSAEEWAGALGRVENQLCKCEDDPGHWYLANLHTCPWCRIASEGGPNFFISVTVLALAGSSSVDVSALWREIEDIATPWQNLGRREPVNWHRTHLDGRPLPEGIGEQLGMQRIVGWISVACIPLTLLAAAVPIVALFTVPVMLVFFGWWATLALMSPLRRVRVERRTALRSAERELERAHKNYSAVKERYDQRFKERVDRLRGERDKLHLLQRGRQEELANLHSNLEQLQLSQYLRQFFIRDAKISGIGSERVAWLASYGIETAHDISEDAVQRVPGFGDVYTARLVAWRRKRERQFRFNPAKGLSHAVVQEIEVRYRQKSIHPERQLRHGPAELRQLVAAAQRELERIAASIAEGERIVAQAKADLDVAEVSQRRVRGRSRGSAIAVIISFGFVVILTLGLVFSWMLYPLGDSSHAPSTISSIPTERVCGSPMSDGSFRGLDTQIEKDVPQAPSDGDGLALRVDPPTPQLGERPTEDPEETGAPVNAVSALASRDLRRPERQAEFRIVVTRASEESLVADGARKNFEAGRALYWKGQYSAALDSLKQAVLIDDSSPIIWYFKALCHYQVGDLVSAERSAALGIDAEGRKPIPNYGELMERCQGRARAWLEGQRRRAANKAH